MEKDNTLNPYLNTSDVEKMYEKLNLGSRKGITSFMEKAKMTATRSNSHSRNGAFIFKDEEALFEVFKSEMPEQIANKKIKYFGELVQMIS